MKQSIQSVTAVLTIPWNAFVAGFLYYTLLAVLALSGLSPSGAVVATAYLMPAVAYLVYVAARLGAASARALQAARLRRAPSRQAVTSNAFRARRPRSAIGTIHPGARPDPFPLQSGTR